jgi:hypothetical protein
MRVSPKQAIELENKLNLSKYALDWIHLGDVLYEWRIHPKYNKLNCETVLKVNKEQYKWIEENITPCVIAEQCFEIKLIE